MWREPTLHPANTNVPAPGCVQNVEATLAEIVAKVLSCFCTEFCTAVLKSLPAMFCVSKKLEIHDKNNSRPGLGGLIFHFERFRSEKF